MRVYKGVNVDILRGESNRSLRSVMKTMDTYLRAVSPQLSTNAASNDASTAGNISSVATDGGSRKTGDLTFTSTPSVAITQAGQDFQWSSLKGTPVTLDATTANAAGNASTNAASNHTHEVTSAAQTGFYGTAATVGSGTGFQRASGVLVFPEALGTAADRTLKATLTDDALTFSAGHTQNSNFIFDGSPVGGTGPFKFSAPASSQSGGGSFFIGRYGNIAIGSAPSDLILLDVSVLTPGNAALNTQTGAVNTWSASLYLAADNASASLTGIAQTLTFIPSVANSVANIGIRYFYTHGANATGAFTAAQFKYTLAGTKATGDIIGMDLLFQANAGTRTATNVTGYKYSPTTGTFTTHLGYNCLAVSSGTTRVSFNSTGATTGTPTDVMGFRSLSHTVGTNRFSFWGDNMHWCDDSDYVCNTAAKGLVCKDAQGTPEFWRIYPSATGLKDATFNVDVNGYCYATRAASPTGTVTLNVQDTGTAAPTA